MVDDEAANLHLLRLVLGDDYTIFSALNGTQALAILKEQDISLIITQQRMPDLTDTQLLEQSMAYRPQAIKILLRDYAGAQNLITTMNAGNVYKYISKPWDADDLKLTVHRALEAYELKENNDSLFNELQKTIAQLKEFSLSTVRALADALDAKCDYTAGHSLRVSRYALGLGKAMTLPPGQLKDIELGGILHDIGKIGVPESILWKPDKLNGEELSIMFSHPVKSAQIIGELQGFDRIRLYVLHHHEFIDGSGYPDKLVGDDIPLGARIILVADAYDAMTSDRPYRQSIGHEKAMDELRKHAGQQFDSAIVETLPAVVGKNGELAQSCQPESITNYLFRQ